jgi:hypothetical protein
MLSVLLSVEELELLVIRHVFEIRLHFLAFVAHLSLNFFLSSSSHGYNPSLIAIGQELMGTLLHSYKRNLMHILPPGLWLGVETIANKPNASLRS